MGLFCIDLIALVGILMIGLVLEETNDQKISETKEAVS